LNHIYAWIFPGIVFTTSHSCLYNYILTAKMWHLPVRVPCSGWYYLTHKCTGHLVLPQKQSHPVPDRVKENICKFFQKLLNFFDFEKAFFLRVRVGGAFGWNSNLMV